MLTNENKPKTKKSASEITKTSPLEMTKENIEMFIQETAAKRCVIMIYLIVNGIHEKGRVYLSWPQIDEAFRANFISTEEFITHSIELLKEWNFFSLEISDKGITFIEQITE